MKTVTCRNDQTHERQLRWQLVSRTITSPIPLDGAGNALPRKVFVQRTLPGLHRVWLRIDSRRGARGVNSPVIQDARNVTNRGCADLLDATQRKIIILRTLEPDAKAA